MATPFVAGAVALIMGQGNYTVRAVRSRLLQSVRKENTLTDLVVSGGALDVDAAVNNATGLSTSACVTTHPLTPTVLLVLLTLYFLK
jgi:subtilisin family serine protease